MFNCFWLWHDWALHGYVALGGKPHPKVTTADVRTLGHRRHNEIGLHIGPLFIAFTWFPRR